MSLTGLTALLYLLAALGAGASRTHVIHVAADGWAEARADVPLRIEAGDAVWIWSDDCLPQRVTADQPMRDCAASEELDLALIAATRPQVATEVRWGTAAMLRELPDALLPIVTTDVAGKLHLRVPRGEQVFARAAGPLLASRWTLLHAPRTSIAAVTAKPLATRIVESSGRDAHHALVEVRTTDVAQPDGLAFRGAGDGTVVIPPIPAGAWVKMLAWSESGAPALVRGTPDRIVLGEGFAIRGRVTDEDDAVVAAAGVTARFIVTGERQSIVKQTRSDARGRFAIAGIPAGEAELTLQKAPFAAEAQVVRIDPDNDLGTVVLRRARDLAVRVTDARKQPVADAVVTSSGGTRATTDGEGRALLQHVPAALFTLSIAAHGFHDAELEIAADTPSPASIVLRDSARIRARLVRAEDGSPAGEGTVSVDYDGRQSVVDLAADGTLDVDDLGAGTVSLEIRAAGLAPFRMPPRQIADGESVDLGTITLGRGLSVTGRLIDEAAAPVAGATVRMLRPSAFGPALAYLQHDWIETRSAVDGTFRLDGLAPGIYALWAEAASRAPVIRGGLELAAELPNGQLDAGDLRLPSGRTVIVECRPVPRCGSHATLTTPGADWLPMTVPWSGDLATLGPIAPGPATLRISDRRGVLHERTVDIAEGEPETRIRVRLAGVEVTGRVVRNGKPVESGQVVLSPSSGAPPRFIQIAQRGASGTIGNEIVGAMPRQLSAPVSDGGAFRLSDVAPGQYTATWSSAAAQSAPQRVTIGESVTPLRIELSGGAVAGLVRAHDGAPQPHALVTAEQGTRRTNVMAAADGTFSVVGLEPGAVTLRASSGPSAIAAATATVTDGQTEHVELTLDDAKETAFDVSVTAAAAPLANAYVFLHDAGSLRAVTTGADGSAAFRIRPGDRPLTIAIYSPAFGWTFAGASTTTGKLSINITAATAGLLLNADRPGPVTIDAPGGFPLHAALAILGIPTITPLRIDHLPRGTYTIRTLNRQELVTLSDRVRDLGM